MDWNATVVDTEFTLNTPDVPETAVTDFTTLALSDWTVDD